MLHELVNLSLIRGRMNSADSAWLLISTALVLFMVPGLALFYDGLVGEKSVMQ